MAKLNDITMDELETYINKRKFKLDQEYKWHHKDRRLKALINEYERRVMGANKYG